MTERGEEVTHHCDVEDMRETPPDSDDGKRAGGGVGSQRRAGSGAAGRRSSNQPAFPSENLQQAK